MIREEHLVDKIHQVIVNRYDEEWMIGIGGIGIYINKSELN